MRILGMFGIVVVIAGFSALGCEQLAQSSGADAGAATETNGTTDAGAIVGGGCGTEPGSGIELCTATSQCPNVVVDTQAMPGCGFRIRGTAVDLVCACGSAVCPMGIFATCAEASQLLSTQTQQGVCVELAEGRCVEAASATGGSSKGSSSGSTNPACDAQCMKDCGGGAACASVCNCD